MKIAIITGASSGLGRAFARRLDRQAGLDELWLIARREGRLSELCRQLQTPARILPLDLTQAESISALRTHLIEDQPEVRYLINAAGFGKFGTYADVTIQEGNDMIDLNCRAAVAMTAVTIPHMGRGGRILQICSSSAFQPLPCFNIYAATKAFLLHYSRALRWEVAGRGICVTAVCPGWIRTEFIQVARATKNGQTVRNYPFALHPDTVVARALEASDKGVAVATCGFPTSLQRACAKLLPACLVMGVWELTRRL